MNGIERFTDKAKKYEKYRPSYPKESLDIIQNECHLTLNNNIIVADIGSGTGKFTEILLKKGSNVYAIEPNDNMRAIAESKFESNHNYKSINKIAENTGLDVNSVDLITVAQALHYFDIEKVNREFQTYFKSKWESGFIMEF